MAIHVALNHVSTYRYDRWVGLSPQVVRLRPAPHCRTPILSYSLRITPEHHFVNWQQDPQGNYLARVVFPDKVRELRVEVDLVAELAVYNPFDFFLEPQAEQFPFVYSDEQARELFPYLRMEALSPRFTGYLGAVSRQSRPTLDFLVELNQRVQRDVAYVIRHEAGVQSKEETLALGRGSCRDSAWLLVQLLRHLGLAARFVSGYLDPARAGRQGARRAGRAREGLHRSARVGRGLPARGGMGRPRRDLRPPRGRGPYPARLHARAGCRGAHHRRRWIRARSSSSTRCPSRASTNPRA